jgi:hypothetical protein
MVIYYDLFAEVFDTRPCVCAQVSSFAHCYFISCSVNVFMLLESGRFAQTNKLVCKVK